MIPTIHPAIQQMTTVQKNALSSRAKDRAQSKLKANLKIKEEKYKLIDIFKVSDKFCIKAFVSQNVYVS